MAENNIKVGDLVTCKSSDGFLVHNCKVVEILDNGRIKAELQTPIRYITARNDQVELENVRDEEEVNDTNN